MTEQLHDYIKFLKLILVNGLMAKLYHEHLPVAGCFYSKCLTFVASEVTVGIKPTLTTRVLLAGRLINHVSNAKI